MRALSLLLVLLAVGCRDRGATDAQQEIAAELRALRVAMQEREATGGGAATVPDASAFERALEPLRELLVDLVREIAQLEERQATLAGELTRWSRLLAQTVTGDGRKEAEALTTRIESLEKALQAEKAHRRSVEKKIGDALDRTSERIESFLRRLGGRDDPGETPEPPPTHDGGDQRQVRAGSSPRREGTVWWYAVAAAAVLGGGLFATWLRRENGAALRPPEGEPERVGAPDAGADELWAAAALLGEAVGRLRQGDGEWEGEALEPLVIPDIDLIPAGEPAPCPTAGDAPGPDWLTLRLTAADPPAAVTALHAILSSDGRVLRHPPAETELRGSELRVRFAVLPELPGGERSHLLGALRAAVR